MNCRKFPPRKNYFEEGSNNSTELIVVLFTIKATVHSSGTSLILIKTNSSKILNIIDNMHSVFFYMLKFLSLTLLA